MKEAFHSKRKTCLKSVCACSLQPATGVCMNATCACAGWHIGAQTMHEVCKQRLLCSAQGCIESSYAICLQAKILGQGQTCCSILQLHLPTTAEADPKESKTQHLHPPHVLTVRCPLTMLPTCLPVFLTSRYATCLLVSSTALEGRASSTSTTVSYARRGAMCCRDCCHAETREAWYAAWRLEASAAASTSSMVEPGARTLKKRLDTEISCLVFQDEKLERNCAQF